MFAMLKQFFSMITVLFSAGERVAKAADNMASWAEETSGQFNDVARAERKQKLAIHNAKMKLIDGTAEAIAAKELESDRVHRDAIKAKELEG